jgi:hypothetical protein
MTSANVIEYTIYDKDHKEVGHHRQNLMCSTCNDGLEKFKPAIEFTIEAWGYDEEEEIWSEEDEEGNSVEHNLQDWLSKHPASFTSRVFQPQDKVKINKKNSIPGTKRIRSEAVVIETIKDKWFHKYNVQLPDGDIIEVNQNELMPL